MLISYLTHPHNFNTKNGYGLAGYGMVKSLVDLGHEVNVCDPNAPVEIAFCQPEWSDWTNPEAYHIQYTPWESTEFPPGWVDRFNSADEVWTPSSTIARWMRDAGVIKPVKVYPHGIEPAFTPGSSTYEFDKFTFLHHGSPAVRKNAQQAVDAFLDLYEGSDRHQLIIKAYENTEVRIKDRSGNIVGDIYRHPNIKVLTRPVPEQELIDLYRGADCMIYNSYGEGFGLIPLQSIATGTPTICVSAWAEYADLLHPSLRLKSTLGPSPWPNMHPGDMFHPSYDDLKVKMLYAEQNAVELKEWHVRQSPVVHKTYNWLKLTENAFIDIVQKFT